MTNEDDESLSISRPQRRLLRRIYNGRTIPIVTAGGSFLTYRAATTYLLSLPMDARDAAYEEMKAFAKAQSDGDS